MGKGTFVLLSPRTRRSFIAWKLVPKSLRLKGRLTFSLKAGERHHFPLLDEEVVADLAGFTDALELKTHEVSFCVGDALAEGSFNVDGEAFGTSDLCFHGCCTGGVLA